MTTVKEATARPRNSELKDDPYDENELPMIDDLTKTNKPTKPHGAMCNCPDCNCTEKNTISPKAKQLTDFIEIIIRLPK